MSDNIEKEDGAFRTHCTRCDTESEWYDTDGDFYEFIEGLKADGWVIRKIGDAWMHYCPDCWEEVKEIL